MIAERDPVVPAFNAQAPREQKLGATARSFAILEYVAAMRATPVDVLDIIAALKLPKATAYRLVDWFVTQGYLSREPGRRRLIVGGQAHQSRVRRTVVFDAQRRLACRAAAARSNAQRDLQYRHAWSNGEVVYLDRVEAEALAAAAALHHRLTGAVALQRDRQAVSRAVAGGAPAAFAAMPRIAPASPSEPSPIRARLDAELRQIGKERVSFDREEYLVGVICMAVPVIGRK